MKVPVDRMSPQQRETYRAHLHAQRVREAEGKIAPRLQKLDAEYRENGWVDDSPFRGVDDARFVQDVEKKDPKTVSRTTVPSRIECGPRRKKRCG